MKKQSTKEKILEALKDKPKKKRIQIEITQKMIDDINKLRKELGIEPLKDKPHKKTILFG